MDRGKVCSEVVRDCDLVCLECCVVQHFRLALLPAPTEEHIE